METVSSYIISKGDEITVHATDPKDGSPIYARVEYIGRNRSGGYIFESTTYGWHWIVSKDKATLKCDYNLDREYPIDNSTGWLRCLPA